MADYKQTNMVGTSYHRAMRILIENPLGEQPTVTYMEERITNIEGEPVQHRVVGNLQGAISMNDMIDLIDPVTYQPTGQSVPVGLIYQALFSDYMAKAIRRDNL